MRPKRFLLVDDDADDADLFCEAISEIDLPAKCDTAENGKKVFEILSQSKSDRPDVIFLDINMPIMNGWDCLRKLKAESAYSDIPVIMYSTSAARKDIDLAYSLGALTFLTKPEDFNELVMILQVVAKTPHTSLLDRLSAFDSVKMSA